MPALAGRPGDAGLLAKHFVKKHAPAMRSQAAALSADARAAIDAWGWPGNVRELENRVKRAVIMADGKMVTAADLDLDAAADEAPINLKAARERADRKAIRRSEARRVGKEGVSTCRYGGRP